MCQTDCSLIACDVVWAELGAFFDSLRSAQDALEELGVQFNPITMDAALAAAEVWKVYRNRGGQRRRMVADFLIGAHALLQADRLLTRDRGFYRAYFSRLPILDPAKQRP